MKNVLLPLLVLTILLSSCVNKCPKNPANISTEGCGDFMAFQKIEVNGFDNTFITVHVMRDQLVLGGKAKYFDVANTPEITSRLEAFNKPYPNYCNDAIDPSLVVLNEWLLISGIAQLQVVRDRNQCTTDYVVDVIF